LPGTFFALEIARRAILASQTNLQVISHNIANSSTPGYSRQRAELRTGPPLAYPSFQRGEFAQQLGGGVEVAAIQRIRDFFLDHIIRNQIGDLNNYDTVNQVYQSLEVLFNEPSESGLGTAINEFFVAWSDLANDPELTGTRANLREKAITLANNFHDYNNRLNEMVADANTQITLKVNEVNNLLGQIADLNKQVMQVEGLGDKANDLKDRRDLLVEQLSEIISINTLDEPDSSVSVMIGALRIVQKDTYRGLETYIIGSDKVGIRIRGVTFPEITAGTLKGLFQVRDETIPEFQRRLDVLASAIANRVNRYHIQGWGLDGRRGRTFFSDTHTAQLKGTIFLPAATTEKTTLFDLGVTQGFFEVQDTRITLTKDEVSSDNSLALSDLLERINQSQPTVRASLQYDALDNPYISFDLYNPAQEDDGIKLFVGSSNFLSLTGLDNATLEFLAGNDFYANASAKVSVSELLQSNLDVIAAGLDPGDDIFPGVGDNTNALRVAAIEDDAKAVEGTTIGDFYNSIIASLGVQSQANTRLVANQEVLVTQLKNQRESISGVNLDEEAINMIEHQRMYEGAARVVSVVDTLLDTLINRMGVS